MLAEFYKFFEKYPQLINKCVSVFDPAYSGPYRQELAKAGFKSIARTYSPKTLTEPIQRVRRLVEKKKVFFFGEKNDAVIWQTGNGYVKADG